MSLGLNMGARSKARVPASHTEQVKSESRPGDTISGATDTEQMPAINLEDKISSQNHYNEIIQWKC